VLLDNTIVGMENALIKWINAVPDHLVLQANQSNVLRVTVLTLFLNAPPLFNVLPVLPTSVPTETAEPKNLNVPHSSLVLSTDQSNAQTNLVKNPKNIVLILYH